MNICTRQTAFIGPKNQKRLQEATVAIIGVGALGSASAHLLMRMGIGKLILCDDDVVADHNLGRQHLYTKADIGEKKVIALSRRLKEIQEETKIISCDQHIDEQTISCCDDADIIIDGTDNHATRRIIDAYAKKRMISWVHGAAIEDKGTVVFFPSKRSYDSVYEGKEKDQHCSISGVLITTTTAVATLQTHLVLLALLGEPIPEVMFRLNGLQWSEISLE
ncbi:MAG: HesA/MoeB/ThiF family protein [Nanoarchaeota archaeon]|nr:HesA/MoeB/ThiF family protein [Nanoarchaeota archaeon]